MIQTFAFVITLFTIKTSVTTNFSLSQMSDMLNIQDAAESARLQGLRWPTSGIDGRYPTRNHLGAMSPHMNSLSQKFINESSKPDGKVLEIGCAYGLVTLEALKSGAKNYVANDMDDGHLKILARKVMEEMPGKAKYLTLLRGSFPESTKIFGNGTFDAILIDNVMHFFTEDQVRSAFKELKRLLKPRGVLFGSASTAYLGFVRQDFIETYKQNVSRFLENPFNSTIPGFTEKTWDMVDWSRFTEQDMENLPLTKGHSFIFDQRIIAVLLSGEKFVILANEYEAVDRKPWSYDGRERLIFIAQA